MILVSFQNQTSTAIFWADKAASLSNGLTPVLLSGCTHDHKSNTGAEEDIFLLARGYYLSQQYHRAVHVIKSNGVHHSSLRCIHLAGECFRAIIQWEELLSIIGKNPSPLEVKHELGWSRTEFSVLIDMAILRCWIQRHMQCFIAVQGKGIRCAWK